MSEEDHCSRGSPASQRGSGNDAAPGTPRETGEGCSLTLSLELGDPGSRLLPQPTACLEAPSLPSSRPFLGQGGQAASC